MLSGYLWTVFLGIIWGIVGVIIATARKRHCPVGTFYSIGSFFAALGSLFFCPFSVENLSLGGILLLALGAGCIAVGQTITLHNLQGPARTILFSIMQINFAFTFILSLLFLNERLTVCSALGMLLLISAVISSGVMANSSGDRSLPDLRRLLIGLGASAVAGCGQFLMLVAGNHFLPSASPAAKAVITLFFCMIFYAFSIPGEWKFFRRHKSMTLRYALLWAVSAALAYRVLFFTLDKMAQIGKSGLVFAIGCSVCILFFFLYSALRLKDKISRRQLLLIAGIIAGVILLRF